MTKMNARRMLLLAALGGSALLSACGGGGGDSTATPLSVVEPPVGGYPAESTEGVTPPPVETPSGGYPGADEGPDNPESGYPAP
ncbi:MAG: hypothetical protein JNL73_13160 [Anaerolineales bacterium]|nr:hypothetical protein [Anaerolineales bacterium]